MWIQAMMLRWVTSTPLGSPVVPLENSRDATESLGSPKVVGKVTSSDPKVKRSSKFKLPSRGPMMTIC